VRAVFDTLIDDFKPVVDCLRDIIANNTGSSKEEKSRSDDAKAILRKIVTKNFVLQLAGTSDIYENFGHVANICQIVDILPHERYDSVMKNIDHFDIMLSSIRHDKCQAIIAENEHLKNRKCLWPRYHNCLESLRTTEKFKGVVVKNDYESKAYNTKLARRNEQLVLATKVEDVTKTNLVALSRRIGSDLKKDTFDEESIKVIEIIRKVCDVKSFALAVKKNGSIQTAHQIGIEFQESSKKLTSTLDEIPDVEIKENFAKFLKVVEKYIKGREVEKLDSKEIIKDFLREPELYSGVELTLHCVTVAAVKMSVESVVESLVSRYENHYDSARQLKEENIRKWAYICQS
jgi:hypothetical protein